MKSLKIIVILFGFCATSTLQSGIVAPAVAPISYTRVIPQNIAPFAASVNTFTKGLSVYAAPYAAGVLPGPAVVPRAALPAPGVVPAVPPVISPYAAAPFLPAPAPVVPGAYAAAPFLPAPAPVVPGAYAAAPFLPAPAPGGYAVAPSLVPSPVAFGARSVHAWGPGIAPAFAPALGAPVFRR